MDGKSNYAEQKVLDHLLGTAAFTMPTGVYVGLHTGDPLDTEAAANELTSTGTGTGSGYARQLVTFDPATQNVDGDTEAASNVQLDWTNLPGATIGWISICDSLTGGHILYRGQLVDETGAPETKTFTAGDNFTINSGMLTVIEA